jgi:hypothetical protein
MIMKGMTVATAILVLVLAAPAGAQQPLGIEAERARAAAGVSAGDTIPPSASAELQQALEQLTATLNALADRISNDPELRIAAVRAAQGMVEVAHVVLVEQVDVVQDALRTAAERIGKIADPDPADTPR